ncbi:hypothetical protein C0J52_09978, partial [Blattella germanica]
EASGCGDDGLAVFKPRVSKKRRFIATWEREFFICKEDNKSVKCLICGKVLSGFFRANIKRHYDRYHASSYDEMDHLERLSKLLDLKKKNIPKENMEAFGCGDDGLALSKPRVYKKRRFIAGWEQEFFICKEDNKSVKCLICKKVLSGFLRANIKRHYDRYHASSYSEMNHLERINTLLDLKKKNHLNEVKVVSGFYTATPTLVHSAAPNVQLRNSDVALIKKNISRAKSIER